MLKKTSIELPEEVWRAAKQRALDDGVDFRLVVISSLEAYLGLKRDAKRQPRKEAKHAR